VTQYSMFYVQYVLAGSEFCVQSYLWTKSKKN